MKKIKVIESPNTVKFNKEVDERIKKYLLDHLSIVIDRYGTLDGIRISVELWLGDKKIDSSSVYVD